MLQRYLGVITIGSVLRASVFSERDADLAKRQTPNAKRILTFGEALRFYELQRFTQAQAIEVMHQPGICVRRKLGL